MNNFNEKLKELRKEKGLNQRDFAKIINSTQVALCRWEQGINSPNIDALYNICISCKVSADYLLGLEDEWGNKINMDAMAHREEYQKPMAKMAAHSKGADEPIQEFEYTKEIKKLFDAIPDEMDENKDKK